MSLLVFMVILFAFRFEARDFVSWAFEVVFEPFKSRDNPALNPQVPLLAAAAAACWAMATVLLAKSAVAAATAAR